MPTATQDHYANRAFLRFVPDPACSPWDNRRIAPPKTHERPGGRGYRGLRTILFNRPAAKNALTLSMRQEFCRVIDAADRDPSVRAISNT